MCLAIPAQITEVKDGNMVEVTVMGATREVSIDLTPQATLGDFVLVHAGFAIEVVDPQFAEDTLELVRQFPDMVEEEIGITEQAM
ncbi:MAG: HypC/HybG/HupF family hydrogenase formation chaperone [Eggerthellaceae bacterium]|jgi:hydrogenase expression/formation protein HypC|uniref:Hydrogenase maturation protein HypC n=1 Tax=Denitrobacterium detoxificans TaxID=79604 RepID=A0A172RW05_9ACTN|nr:HypC/HybG/HupF family hydrogenase formation chaperone [Denitrobacterium detoxificans]ANE21892.1 hydrogenase assembly protein HypC [Denitrobacterium detoxificans]MBE6466883.1 HypC/HybG/HupF family hydrogenase formation chaperone [Denitrobacterium detoxificans]MCR5582831.1 HypC/HybG/HupF family hydrogenase formation chaperone [Eggerthellaceae bacterium]SEO44572.1 Hydrogenase maturation protein HypC [Denitrobacterium detoxificans]